MRAAAERSRDALRAGFETADAVRASLAGKPAAIDVRVRVRYAGEDPRVALRNDDRLSGDALADLARRLERIDARAHGGPWTLRVLELIEERPDVRAPDLAESASRETSAFKADVRKSKALGLTISHSPGYELSPPGRALLAHLRR